MTFSFLSRFAPRPASIGVLAMGLLLSLPVPAAAQRYVVQEAGLDGGGGLVTGSNLVLISSLASGPAGTVSTDRYVLFSAMPSPFSGQAAILIVHTPAEAAQNGQPQPITARIVTNNAPLQSAALYYRTGTGTEPTTVSMTPDDNGFVATIPGSAVGATGLTYYFVAVDEDGTSVRAPRRGVYALPVQLGASSLARPGAQPGGDTQAAYRLLSVPVILDDASPEAVLGDDVPTLAGAGAYDPAVARLFEPLGTRVAEFPGTGDFELGRAFWLIVRDGVEDIDVDGGTAGALNEPVRISLTEGWNFLGTPFTVPVPVSNLRAANGATLTLRSYGSGGYNTPDNPVTVLQPFGGYAVFSESATTLTVEPPLLDAEKGHGVAKARNGASGYDWRLRLRAASRAGWDADNVAAVHADAADGWDAQDWPEPPSLGSGLRLAFDTPENAPADVRLSADVRRPPSRGTTWPLTLRTDAAGPVRLSVDGLPQLPDAFEAWLVDATTKTTWNLRQSVQARVDVLSEEGTERALRLVVGTEEYVREVLQDLEALPLELVLRPPYPNPSSGPVAFQVGLPEENRVTIAVYNLLGQRIAVLKDDESMTAGFHTVVWNAPRLASGLYFVHMKAGSYRKAQKLVRIQ